MNGFLLSFRGRRPRNPVVDRKAGFLRALHVEMTRGFTLIELLICIVILSAGIVVIDQVLLASVSALSYVDNRTDANRMMANKIWEIGAEVEQSGKFIRKKDAGVMSAGAQKIDYELHSWPIDSATLFGTELTLRWEQTGRKKSITRTFYTLMRNEKKA